MSGLNIIALILAVMSLLAAVAALFLFCKRHGSDPSTSSRLLWIVMMLILSDACVAMCVLVWHGLQSGEHDADRLHSMCRVFLPFPIYFFLSGYGWTIMVAWRFQQVSERIKLYEPPFSVVWGGAFLLVLPVILLNIFGGSELEVSNTISTSSEDGIPQSYCVFNSGTAAGLWTNNVCFQLPLLVTIAANVYAFSRGIRALRNSPQSVVAREMDRAGKYLFVLLLVWVPNFLANLVQVVGSGFSSQSDDADDEHLSRDVSYFVEVMVIMSSSQGLLNVAVYAYGHKTFRKYLQEALRWSPAASASVPLLSCEAPSSCSSHLSPPSSAPEAAVAAAAGGVAAGGCMVSPDSSQREGGNENKRLNFSVRGDSSSDEQQQERTRARDKFSRLGAEKAVRFAD